MRTKTPAREIIKDYVEKGMSIQEIVEITGLKYTTVQAARRKLLGNPSKRRNITRKKGWNKDRHACKVCQFRLSRMWDTRLMGHCDYIGVTGKRRPCAVEDCSVYQRGNPMISRTGE